MKTHFCVWTTGLALLALGTWFTMDALGQEGAAKGLKEGVLKIAASLKKGETATATKEAADLSKKIDDLADLMDLFKKRDKGGLGVGSKPGVVTPDGMESKLVALGRDAPSITTLKKEADALEEMGYTVAAIGLITKSKPAPKAKEWSGWCDDLVTGGQKLSAAAKSQTAAELKSVAAKINASCNACHSAYRK